MKPETRRRLWTGLRVVLVLGVVAGCIGFSRTIGWERVRSALATASWSLVGAAAALNLVGMWWRSSRLSVILVEGGAPHIPTQRSVRYNLAASAANNLLPARAGEVVRPLLLKLREGVPFAAGVSASIVEKVLDVVAMLLVSAPFPLLLPGLPSSVAYPFVIFGGAALAALVLLWLAPRIERGSPKSDLVKQLVGAARLLRRPGAFAHAMGLSLLVWIADAITVLLVLRAVGVMVPAAGSLLVLLILNAAIALPSTPGHVGVFEGGAVGALAVLHVEREPALAFALLYHAMQLVPVTLLGLPDLLSASAARRREEAERQSASN